MQALEKMKDLRLSGMYQMWHSLTQSHRHLELDLQEGLELLLQAEEENRQAKRLERLRKAAGFRYQASLEEIDFGSNRGLDKSTILSLGDGQFIEKGACILITGATGTGKSFIASALGHQACSLGYKTLYFNMQKLMEKLKIARAEGTYMKLTSKISKHALLILDDFGLQKLNHQQRLDLLEIIEDRHGVKSTIISSQLPVEKWYDIIGDSTVADAIMDRLVHGSKRIELKGKSLREKM
jgi:DNA replication protein DnaC